MKTVKICIGIILGTILFSFADTFSDNPETQPAATNQIQQPEEKKPHACIYKFCPMKGQTEFKGCEYCEVGSNCYLLDEEHWRNPTDTYDENEKKIFGDCVFKDGEGNFIPVDVVKLFIGSQFYQIDKEDSITVSKYFR